MHHTDHRCRSAHVSLHVFHTASRFDGDPAGIKHNALADKRNGSIRLFATVPAHDRKTRRAHGTLGNPKQSCHLELFHFLFAQDLYLDTESFELSSFFGKFNRTQNICRLVDQIARKHHPIGNRF